MTDTLSLPETTLKLFYNNLYPDLTNETNFSSYPPVETFDYSIENLSSQPQIVKTRKTFIDNWRNSVHLETEILVELSQAQTKNKRELKRELEKEVDIKVSQIFNKYRSQTLMLTVFHPNTFLFLEVVKEICKRLNIDYFSDDQCKRFLEKNNYMELP